MFRSFDPFDGVDRLSKTRYPLPTKGANASSTIDFEQLTYDSNSNVTARQLRDGGSLAFTYDSLDRVTNKTVPGDPNVSYSYDNLGRLLSASASGNAVEFTYDALSRKLTEGSTVSGTTLTSTLTYDAADRLSTIAYPAGGGALTISYGYLTTGELLTVNQASTNLATYGYDNLGRRTSATFENGAAQSFGWDPVSRLASLTNDLAGTSNDLSVTFSYNPASQIVQTVRTGDAYAYTAQGSGSTAYTANGLNQQISIDGAAATWDAKGNLATEPQSNKAYCYSPENLLKRVSTPAAGCDSPSATLAYDPLLRLSQVTASGTTRFAYNGADAVAEYDGSGNLLRRFIIDPTAGAPVMEFAGSGTGTSFHRFYGADERGSIVSATDISGNVVGLNRYDEYGKPQSTNIGRYQYTGQKWIGEVGLYDYKARDYLPHLGIFAQPDPVGYVDSPNLYAYVLDDPINLADPSGLGWIEVCVTIQGGSPSCGVRWQNEPSMGMSGLFGGIGGVVGSNESGDAGNGGRGKEQNNPCPPPAPDTASKNYRDEQELFNNVAAASDVVAVTALAAAVIFPPAATVAATAKAFSLGATAVSGAFAVAESLHTGDVRYAGGAGLQLVGQAIGGRIGGNLALGIIGAAATPHCGTFRAERIQGFRQINPFWQRQSGRCSSWSRSMPLNMWLVAAILACMWVAMHDRYVAGSSARGWKSFWADKTSLAVLSKILFMASIACCAAIPFAPSISLPASVVLFVAHGATAILHGDEH